MKYYISIALLWQKYVELNEKIVQLIPDIPFSQRPIRENARHCTLFAVAELLKADEDITPGNALRDAFAKLPHPLIRAAVLKHTINAMIRPDFFAIRDNTSTVQFELIQFPLAKMRDELRAILGGVEGRAGRGILASMAGDKNKSNGSALFGSFARRSEALPQENLLYRRELDIPPIAVRELDIHVTISDEALTNIRHEGEDYFSINTD